MFRFDADALGPAPAKPMPNLMTGKAAMMPPEAGVATNAPRAPLSLRHLAEWEKAGMTANRQTDDTVVENDRTG